MCDNVPTDAPLVPIMVYKLACRYICCTCGSQAQTHAFHLPFLYSCGSLIHVAVRWLCCGHCAWFACILQLLLLSFYHRFQWPTASRDTCVRLQIRLQKIQQTTRTQQCLHHVFSSSMCPLWPSWPGTRRHSNLTYSGHLRGQLLFLNVVSHFPTFNFK